MENVFVLNTLKTTHVEYSITISRIIRHAMEHIVRCAT